MQGYATGTNKKEKERERGGLTDAEGTCRKVNEDDDKTASKVERNCERAKIEVAVASTTDSSAKRASGKR